MTRTTPEMTTPPYFRPNKREDVCPLRMISRTTVPIQDGSSAESGFEPGALRPQSQGPTTRPPRALNNENSKTDEI
ncbi:hypothetical protein AVEN_46010-1 [Araneus ventricosus]|uniref:Uncharacterized protein n=1 Tax=Araneus ventricosus TaxID=182803 RepID=A0A4Y2F529_ARAVE|nr:hypothetical protein AVEN_46010-1 [Araneus ventricosus]